MNISEEQLMLLYLGELDPKQAERLLQSAEVCAQLRQLEADMQAIENQTEHHLPDDYGHQLWDRIADRIVSEPHRQRPSIWQQLSQWLAAPQFSMASIMLVGVLVFSAYWTGRQDQSDMSEDLTNQLLAQNIQMHLTQSEIFLTQAKNRGLGNDQLQTMAQRLLTSNRIYKRAAVNHEGQHTALLLSNLEQILLEYANGAPSESTTLPALQDKSNRGQELLFQVKSMKQQLAKDDNII